MSILSMYQLVECVYSTRLADTLKNPLDYTESRVRASCAIFMMFILFPFVWSVASSLFGFVITYKFYQYYGSRYAGNCTHVIINFKLFHMRHWQIYALLLFLSLQISLPPILIGVCFGSIVYGIQFNDWCTFVPEQMSLNTLTSKSENCHEISNGEFICGLKTTDTLNASCTEEL